MVNANRSNRNSGSILLTGLIFSVMFVSFLSYSLYQGSGIYNKVKLQNIADSCAYSGALAQAKILNSISALNQAISLINNIVTKIVLIWLALKACGALCIFGFGCACLSPLRFFERVAKPILNQLKNIAWAMARIQDALLKYGPFFVLGEIHRVAKLNGIKWVLPYPFLPKGPSSSRAALNFRLERANEASELEESGMSVEAVKLSGRREDLMSCYEKKWGSSRLEAAYSYYLRSRSSNIKWVYSNPAFADRVFSSPKGSKFVDAGKEFNFSHATVTECRKVSTILSSKFKLPNPLVLKKDFTEKQKLALLISNFPFNGHLSFDEKESQKKRFFAASQARPFGPTIFKMKWRAKLTPLTLMNELLGQFKAG